MKVPTSPRLLCICLIVLVHATGLVESQLDFGDRPKITPAPGSPPRGGAGGQGSPPRGGGGAGSPPRAGAPPPRAGAGGGGSRPPPPRNPLGGQGQRPNSSGSSGGGPPIIEAGGGVDSGLREEGNDEGDETSGILGLGRGRPRGRGLFGLGGRRGQQQPQQPPPQQGQQPPQIIPQSICTLKADPGFCNLIIGRWYYDHRYHRCLPFLYTGCGGNINNFYSIRQCEQATEQCHAIGYSPSSLLHSGLTPGALNPLNPLAHLAPGYVLGG